MSTDPRAAPAGLAPGAYGLAIASEVALPGIEAAAPPAGGRRVAHSLVALATLEARLGDEPLTALLREGRGPLRVECHRHPSGALLIRTASFGSHLIADAGRTVLSAVAGVPDHRWQRYLLGQVLPLTASVQGLEVFHASAVVVEGGVLALAGPSGAGKSSIAAALLARAGAAFFSDDVLALDATAFGLTAHPGPTLLSLPQGRYTELDERLLAGPPWLVNDGKVVLPVRGERRPRPVRSFLRLAAGDASTTVSFAPCLPDRLMATTFDGVSRGPERRLRLLRVAALLASEGRAGEVRYPRGGDPQLVADAVIERLARTGAAGEPAR